MADLKKWLAQGANPDNELGDAIVANDIERVRYLLAHGAHPDARDGEGYTPLINATRFSFVEVATYLAGHKADVNLGDRNDWRPLMYAAWQDNPELVSMLISTAPRSTSCRPTRSLRWRSPRRTARSRPRKRLSR